METAIRKVQSEVGEWDKVGWNDWLEDHPWCAVVDPIIQALGWDNFDPKVWHLEFPRPFTSGRVDYAVFRVADVPAIVNVRIPHDIVIEAKALWRSLDDTVPQLRRYACASPRMQRNRSVLTNGNGWWIYDLGLPGVFTARMVR